MWLRKWLCFIVPNDNRLSADVFLSMSRLDPMKVIAAHSEFSIRPDCSLHPEKTVYTCVYMIFLISNPLRGSSLCESGAGAVLVLAATAQDIWTVHRIIADYRPTWWQPVRLLQLGSASVKQCWCLVMICRLSCNIIFAILQFVCVFGSVLVIYNNMKNTYVWQYLRTGNQRLNSRNNSVLRYIDW